MLAFACECELFRKKHISLTLDSYEQFGIPGTFAYKILIQ